MTAEPLSPTEPYDLLAGKVLPRAMARQAKALRDLSGSWSLDLSTGRARVGDLESSIQVIGSVNSAERTWLAGWAVVEVNGLDPALGRRSGSAQETGQALEVDLLSEHSLGLDAGLKGLGAFDPFLLAMVTANLEEAVTLYCGPTPNGALYFTLEDHDPAPLSAPALGTLLVEVTSAGLHRPQEGLASLFELEGFGVTDSSASLSASRSDASFELEFDHLGRVAGIRGSLNAAPAVP
jgi:hypothetical protein